MLKLTREGSAPASSRAQSDWYLLAWIEQCRAVSPSLSCGERHKLTSHIFKMKGDVKRDGRLWRTRETRVPFMLLFNFEVCV